MGLLVRLLGVPLVAIVSLGLAGCGAAGGAATPSPVSPPPVTQGPAGPSEPDRGPDEGELPDGGQLPGGDLPGQPGDAPGAPGQPELVVPRPGQQMVHPVPASELVAQVVDGRLVLNVRWWSGVEPCAVLDTVGVTRDGTTFTITLLEGTSDPDAICIAIAVEKVVAVDLGPVEPGEYTIVADPGEARPLTVTVP